MRLNVIMNTVHKQPLRDRRNENWMKIEGKTRLTWKDHNNYKKRIRSLSSEARLHRSAVITPLRGVVNLKRWIVVSLDTYSLMKHPWRKSNSTYFLWPEETRQPAVAVKHRRYVFIDFCSANVMSYKGNGKIHQVTRGFYAKKNVYWIVTEWHRNMTAY